ncbi:MAG: TldD/PmbA family protein [Cyanobacteria bacterium J06614_10]
MSFETNLENLPQPPIEQLPEQLPEQLLERAIAAGADAAEIYQTRSLETPVIFEGNRLKQVETTQAEGVALRLWQNGKPGLAVGYGPIDPQLLVEKALAISTLNEPETPQLAAGTTRDFGAVGEPMAIEQLVEKGKEAIALIREQVPEIVCEASLSCDREQVRLLTSTGLDYRWQDTTLSGYISAELVNQNDFLCVGDGTANRNQLDMTAVANSINQRLTWAERTVDPINGQLPVIFTADAAGLLWDTLRAALNGKRVKEGTSPWIEKWGDRVLSDRLTLRQDPTTGPYSCPFDDEGLLTQPLTFIENGLLKSWFHDLTTGATKADLPGFNVGSTGNGIRPGLGSYPTPGLINLLIAPGDLSWDTLIAQQSDAIIVDQVMGEGGDITGDLSINLELGYRVSQGEIIGRVKNTMVSGNAYTALKNLIALGSDTDWSGSTYSPSLVVGGLSITS